MLEPSACVQKLAAHVEDLHLLQRRVRLGTATNDEEERLCAGWTALRKAEFRTGRACARELLASLGVWPLTIGFDREGAPSWPEGFVGSISHKRGFCLVGTARESHLRAVGLDLERAAPGAVAVSEIASGDELAALRGMPAFPGSTASLLLAAKEAAYKCQYSLTGAVLSWRELVVSFDEGTFTAHLPGQPGLGTIEGFYAAADGWLATVALVKA